MLLNIVLSFILLNYTYAFNPSCNSCKWFIPYKDNDYGLCKFYKNIYPILGTNITIYEYATHCRNNESMCGEKGYMYEPDNSISIITPNLSNKYKEHVNLCSIEVNEKSELRKFERDMFETMQKIKKHNIRNIYKNNE